MGPQLLLLVLFVALVSTTTTSAAAAPPSVVDDHNNTNIIVAVDSRGGEIVVDDDTTTHIVTKKKKRGGHKKAPKMASECRVFARLRLGTLSHQQGDLRDISIFDHREMFDLVMRPVAAMVTDRAWASLGRATVEDRTDGYVAFSASTGTLQQRSSVGLKFRAGDMKRLELKTKPESGEPPLEKWWKRTNKLRKAADDVAAAAAPAWALAASEFVAAVAADSQPTPFERENLQWASTVLRGGDANAKIAWWRKYRRQEELVLAGVNVTIEETLVVPSAAMGGNGEAVGAVGEPFLTWNIEPCPEPLRPLVEWWRELAASTTTTLDLFALGGYPSAVAQLHP